VKWPLWLLVVAVGAVVAKASKVLEVAPPAG
jgi:hypothetical protein